MNFIKKLYNRIIDSMYYVELQLITYSAAAYIIFVVCQYRIISGTYGWVLEFTFTLPFLYLFSVILFIFHIINKKYLHKNIDTSHEFHFMTKFLYSLIFLLNFVCHTYMFVMFFILPLFYLSLFIW